MNETMNETINNFSQKMHDVKTRLEAAEKSGDLKVQIELMKEYLHIQRSIAKSGLIGKDEPRPFQIGDV